MLTVRDAAAILDTLYSDQDPIYHRGGETTAQDLAYSELADKNAVQVRVLFWRLRGDGLVKGSLRDVILDRLGVPRSGLKKWRFRHGKPTLVRLKKKNKINR